MYVFSGLRTRIHSKEGTLYKITRLHKEPDFEKMRHRGVSSACKSPTKLSPVTRVHALSRPSSPATLLSPDFPVAPTSFNISFHGVLYTPLTNPRNHNQANRCHLTLIIPLHTQTSTSISPSQPQPQQPTPLQKCVQAFPQ